MDTICDRIYRQQVELHIDYEDGSETHKLTVAETNIIIQGGRINVNAMLRIAKKRKLNVLIKGDIKQ